MIDYIFWGIIVFVCIISIWHIRCSRKTYTDRAVILLGKMQECELDQYFALCDYRDAVSFGNHHWALFTFRDPWKLYHNEIQELMK